MFDGGGAATRALIWVVDDSPTQAAFVERALGDGYRYERFAEGASVIERLAVTPTLPDLVLLDWVMPGLSGDEVCRHIRQQPATRELPIVILTASRTDTDDVVCALESGANDYVTKPFSPAELLARVRTILRSVEMQRAAEREHRRVLAINAFAATILQAETVEGVLEAITRWLVDAVVDGASISLEHEAAVRERSHHRSEEAAASIAAGGGVVRVFSVRDIATARVSLTRDSFRGPLDVRDARMIETSLEYSALAIEAALRSERERKTTRFHEEMVGIVGHDLRGPLSAFGLGIDLLRDGQSDPRSLETLARLERSSSRMGRIIEQLLDVTRARIGSGIQVTRRRVGLKAIIESVADEMRLARPGIRLVLSGEEVEGSWDPGRLEQVVANLAGNAAQHGRVGTPITFGVSVSAGMASIVVHNENRAAPIPADMLTTMFDPFERGRATGSADGLGLGLYIVQQIVKAHHGSISVTSDEAGTSFRLRLPLDGG